MAERRRSEEGTICIPRTTCHCEDEVEGMYSFTM